MNDMEKNLKMQLGLHTLRKSFLRSAENFENDNEETWFLITHKFSSKKGSDSCSTNILPLLL